MKKVGIAILNWNGLEDTLECLNSLNGLSYQNWQAIVVDNASKQSPDAILEQFPTTCLIKSPTNTGFAGGNNLAFQKAADLDCDYVWVLNNDTVVAEDSLSKLVSGLESNPNLGAVTNLVTFYGHPEISWFAGGTFSLGLPRIIGYFERVDTKNEHHNVVDTEYLCGCSFLAPIDLLMQLDGFDESYFCYVEDIDISIRLLELDYKLGYVPAAIVAHKVSRSSGNGSATKIYYKHRNMIYFIRKFNKSALTRIYWWGKSLRYTASLLMKHKKPNAAKAIIEALLDGERNRMGQRERDRVS